MISDNLTPLPSTIPPGSTVDCYLRDSGGEKQDRSIARQLEAVKTYCARYGLHLRTIYKDTAKSGTTTAGRDDFHRMIADTRDEDHRPVAILLWNYARFARDLDDSTYYKALLRSKRGIIIHSLTDNIPEGPYARFVEVLIDIANEEKSRQTSMDTRDGLRSIVKQGAVPGVPPRGFKREPIVTINPRTGEERKNHRWVPDPKYINRVRKAFYMRAQGASLNQIQKATKLFSSTNSYATFWTNKLFIGTLEYGGEIYENYCEPTVPKHIWDKVQIIQQKYQQSQNLKSGDHRHPRRQASDFLLSGLARCARCGSPLYGRTSHQKTGYKYQSYLCTLAYRKRGACTKGRIPRPAFETAILNQLKHIILTPENLNDILRLQAARAADQTEQHAEKRRDILARIAANKKRRENIADALEESGKSTTLQKRLDQLELEAEELQLEWNELENKIPQATRAFTEFELTHYIQRVQNILKDKDEQAKKTLLRGIIAYIDVERQEDTLKGTIYIFVPDPDDPLPTDDSETPSPSGDDVPTPRHSSGPLLLQPSKKVVKRGRNAKVG